MTYDIAGRPKKYRNNTVEWNGSQMTKYGRNTYEYDGNNYRVFKQTPSEKTYYSYDGSGNLRFERRGRTEINYIYDAGGIRGMKVTVPTDDPSTYYASSEFYYVKDSLGNIRVILDKSGNIMVEYNYDAWGNFVAEKVREASIGSVAVDLAELNAFTYRGYYYDKESGLYYLINRYYDPVTGRFISPDDVGYLDFESFFGTNRYAYCLDNPVNYIDPDGTDWESFWNGVGNWFEEHWKEVVIGTAFIIVGALISALTCGGTAGFLAAFGSALLSSAIQVGVSVSVAIGINGLGNIIRGNGFFDNVGDTIASSYMWAGIFSGGSQILSGGFRFLRTKGYVGIDTLKIGFMSPDKLYYDRPGMTLIRLGTRKGAKISIDLGRYGIHAHIIGKAHIPVIPILVGTIELIKNMR